MTQQQVSAAQDATAGVSQDRDRQSVVLPAVDVFETPHGITLLADLPGVPRESLEIKVEDESLLIEGAVQTKTKDGLEAVHAEVRVPRYCRSFVLRQR